MSIEVTANVLFYLYFYNQVKFRLNVNERVKETKQKSNLHLQFIYKSIRGFEQKNRVFIRHIIEYIILSYMYIFLSHSSFEKQFNC